MSLARAIAPTQLAAFLQEVWNQASLHIAGERDRFRDIFSWDELNRVLEEHRLEPPRLRLEQAGRTEAELAVVRYRPARRGREIAYIDVPSLYARLREGATLVLDSVDEMCGAVRCFAEEMERELGAHVEANCYAAWGETPGFGVHWDDHDLIVVQIAGRKRWQMFEQARPFPLYRDIDPNLIAPSEPLWERIIEPGDVIYIPRGHWHGATGVGEPTLHLTFGVNNPVGVDFLTWVIDELRASELVRSDIPRFGGAEQLAQYEADLISEIQAYWNRSPVERYLESRKAALPARPHISLPEGGRAGSIAPDTVIAFAGVAHSLASGGSAVELRTLGRQWTFHPKALGTLGLLLEGRPRTVAELVAAGDAPQSATLSLLESLLERGFAYRCSRQSVTKERVFTRA